MQKLKTNSKIPVVTITIGRNIKTKPMPALRWQAFKSDINSLFLESFVAGAESRTEWQGIKETSAIFFGKSKLSSSALTAHLSRIASLYSQDAIGLAINSRASSLVERT